LKKTQDVLGDLHDRQVLVDDLQANAAALEGVEIDPSHVTLIRQFVAAESRDLHARFTRRRSRLLEISDRFEPIERRRLPVAPAAAAVIISSAYYLWRRSRAPQPPLRDHGISMRIPIPERAMIAR
jgi:hypothetical protein